MADYSNLQRRSSYDSQTLSVSDILRRISYDSQTLTFSETGSTTATIQSQLTSVGDSGVSRGSGQLGSHRDYGTRKNQEVQQTRPSQHPYKMQKKIRASSPELQARLNCLIYGTNSMPEQKQRKNTSPGQVQRQQSMQQKQESINESLPNIDSYNNMSSGSQYGSIHSSENLISDSQGNQLLSVPVVENCLGSTVVPVVHQDQGYDNPGYSATPSSSQSSGYDGTSQSYLSPGNFVTPCSSHSSSYDSISQSPLDVYDITALPEKQEIEPNYHHNGNHDQSEASSPEEKVEWFTESFSTNLSILYAICLVICGTTFYIGDSFNYSQYVLGEAFKIYIMVVSLAYLIYIHYDVRKYLKIVSQTLEEAEAELKRTTQDNINNYERPTKPLKVPERHYGFTSGRHDGSLYLKIGATCFCLGYLTYIGLTFGKMIMHIGIDDCYSMTHLIGTAIHTVYIAYQLFFLFKYSNLIINRYKIASRFGLMHCIGSSICFWIFFIYYEVLHSIPTEYANESAAMNSTNKWVVKYGCKLNDNETSTDALDSIVESSSPYLYPFGVEFNILIVGLWICIWENLGKIENHDHMPSVQIVSEDNTKSFSSNLVIQVDCHSSNRGIFMGLLFTIYIIISIIIFFVYTHSATDDESGYLLGMYIRAVSELMLLVALLIASIIAYRSIQNLDVISHEISSVDDLLLFVCIPFIIFFAFINIVALVDQKSIPTEDYILIVVMIIYIIQPIVQTLFICDGLRRCSNTPDLQFKKPGREVVTFLIITNVTMWLLETIQINTHGANEAGYYYYGKTMWKVMSHVSMPLSLFYRFHSSVCIADIWNDAYDQEHH